MILRMPMNAHDTGVTADAVEFVREAIRSGRYLPGDRIVEREISEELGISSIAVRDAFARLTLEGWIERLPRDRKSTRLNSSHSQQSRMPSSA